jgi:hypothetical protein
VLLREYLDVWHERLDPGGWETRLVGIEAFDGYRNPIHEFVYDEVHYGTAQTVLPTLGEFDAILIADVIEHLEMSEAQELVRLSVERSRAVIISTPIEFYAQEDHFGNRYEQHRCHWTRDSFPDDLFVHTIHTPACWIFVASREPIDPSVFALAEPADVIYLYSRQKLGKLGWPISAGLRLMCKWFA